MKEPLSPPFDNVGKQGEWEKIGFVKSEDNSTTLKNYSYSDLTVKAGSKYKYRLKQIDNNGNFSYSREIEVIANFPQSWTLNQNYPNPFNPGTVISYQLPVSSKVTLKVYDILGNEIETLVNQEEETGFHSVNFNAAGLSSGIYFYRLNAVPAGQAETNAGEVFSETKSMVLVK